MTPFVFSFLLTFLLSSSPLAAAVQHRNIWEREYVERSAESVAAQFESDSRPVFRYRTVIADLLAPKPGMVVAEIGAGSGFLGRLIAQRVGPQGRVIATELDEKMVTYMNRRAAKEGLANFTAIRGSASATGLQPDSVDAIVMVNTYSFFDRPGAMVESIARSLRAGGLLLVVDFSPDGQGRNASGIDAQSVIRTVTGELSPSSTRRLESHTISRSGFDGAASSLQL